jgi:NitT/TauT family transport system substrate-binding protein/putative hydroxymethylpyrimidine transport system substrate-binding protein
MRRVAAPLAAVVCALAAAGCGGDGAEPGAPEGATLVLDFQPNAVHAGIYAGKHEGYFEDEGVALTIREPSSTSDAPSLLEAGRADFAVMDINDYGIARERGADLVAIAAIVQRPLASVIAGDRNEIRAADLEGKTVGVTGVPSDDAVLDTVLAADGLDPDSVERVTIGFNAVSALAAGRIDAATAFWNAEGVELKRLGIPTREFRVDEFGAPRYPELLLVTRSGSGEDGSANGVVMALARGYELLSDDPDGALENLLAEVPGLDRSSQRAQLDALTSSEAFALGDSTATPELDAESVARWDRWARQNGLLGR